MNGLVAWSGSRLQAFTVEHGSRDEKKALRDDPHAALEAVSKAIAGCSPAGLYATKADLSRETRTWNVFVEPTPQKRFA